MIIKILNSKFVTVVLYLFFSNVLPTCAQNWVLEVRQNQNTPYKIVHQGKSDSTSFFKWVQQYQEAQLERGYLEIKREGTGARVVRLTLGERHFWEYIDSKSLPVRGENWRKKSFSLKYIENYRRKILQYAENNGYPFAQIRLDSLNMQSNLWRAKWHYEPRLRVTFDSVVVVGKVKTTSRFLRQYLRLQPKTPFSQAKIEHIRTRLQRLPYLRLQGEPTVRFLQDKAFVVLPLEQVKANQIDGIVGVLPNENQRGQLLLTGELNAQFYNLFTQGQTFKVQWQRLQTASQRLEIHTGFQTLFNTPLQLQADFKLFRQDSSFVNQSWEGKLGYATQDNSEFFAQLLRQKSNLGDANSLYQNTQLPDISETIWLGYGIGYKVQTLDDIFFPKRGWQVSFSVYTGTKQIVKNQFLPDTLYKNLQLKTPQTLTQLYVQRYFGVGKGVLRVGVQGAYIANKQLFMNELMRIGGLTSLRGHNQNVFFASQYIITTLEYRLRLDGGSYIFAFYDQAYYERRVIGTFQADTPAGIGVGANLSLKAGVFSLAYALGKDKENNFAFNRAKIHFGVVSKF